METNLSMRLAKVADFVPQGAKVLDVGSDHAYLPIALIEVGKISTAIAGEVVNGPYESAVANVDESQLSQQIEVRLANGLAAFSPEDKVTVITICGMGGRLITDILDAGKEKLAQVERLILQPNNREDDLRRWLSSNRFIIVAEAILKENDKIYEIIVAEQGQENLTAQESRFGKFLSSERSDVFIEKWEREISKLTFALNQVPEDNHADRSIILQKIDSIKEVLGNESK